VEAFVPELWNLIKTAGPFVALLGYLWLDERSDRKRIQKSHDELVERVLKGLNDATVSSNATISAGESIKNAIQTIQSILIAQHRQVVSDDQGGDR
jgi:hypothetical protein